MVGRGATAAKRQWLRNPFIRDVWRSSQPASQTDRNNVCVCSNTYFRDRIPSASYHSIIHHHHHCQCLSESYWKYGISFHRLYVYFIYLHGRILLAIASKFVFKYKRYFDFAIFKQLSYYITVYTLRRKRKGTTDDWTKRLCTGRTVFFFSRIRIWLFNYI